MPTPYIPPPERGIMFVENFAWRHFDQAKRVEKSQSLMRLNVGISRLRLKWQCKTGRRSFIKSALFYKKVKIALQNLFLFVENVLFFGFTMI